MFCFRICLAKYNLNNHIVINYAILSVFLELCELSSVILREEGTSFSFPKIIWIWSRIRGFRPYAYHYDENTNDVRRP